MATIALPAPKRRKIYLTLLVLGLLAGAPWAATHALFTDSQDITGNTFSTGSVDISASPATALVTLTTMAPGDKVTGELTVTNAGTLQLRYAMTTGITGSTTLADGLEAQIKTGVTTCSNAGFDTDGTSVYNSTLTSAAIGSTAQGGQAGDRTLNPSASEVLCFQVRLPSSAGASLQGLSTTATFTFAAEQTTNNP
jgi:camelysin-like metallo-endopeptidase